MLFLSPTHRRRPTRVVVGALLPLLLVLAAVAPLAASAQTASQLVSFEVLAINQIAVSANPSALVISTATAGSAPTSATSSATTWAVTTNEIGKKVTASLNSAMPSGITLSLTLGAPGAATSSGAVALGTTAVDLVTGLTKLNAAGLTITYTLAATSAAGTHSADSRTVTLTLVAGP